MSVIQLHRNRLPPLLPWAKVRYSIDGGPDQICARQETTIPVWPGWHHLRVWAGKSRAAAATALDEHRNVTNVGISALRSMDGERYVADMRLHVPDGQVLRVVYRPGWTRRAAGRLRVDGIADVAPIPALGTPAAYAADASPASSPPPAGWHPDPTGRHQQRWWDGRLWTPAVADGGATSNDPV